MNAFCSATARCYVSHILRLPITLKHITLNDLTSLLMFPNVVDAVLQDMSTTIQTLSLHLIIPCVRRKCIRGEIIFDDNEKNVIYTIQNCLQE